MHIENISEGYNYHDISNHFQGEKLWVAIFLHLSAFWFFFLMGIINYVIVKNMTILPLNMKITSILTAKGHMPLNTMSVWTMRAEACKAICGGKKLRKGRREIGEF